MRQIIFISILMSLLIMGCAEASDPTESAEKYLSEVVRIPTNGDAYSIDYSDSYIAVAEYDAGLSLINRNTYERKWYTEVVGTEGSVMTLGRNRRVNLVEEMNFLLFTEEYESDNYQIVDISKTDTLEIIASITGGTFSIQQIELYPYDDPDASEYQNFTAKGFFVNDKRVNEIAWDSLTNSITTISTDNEWRYPVRVYGTYLADDYVYTAAGQRGVFVSDRDSYNIVTEFNTPGQALKLELHGDYLYVATRQTGLCVYNVADIYNPVEVYSYETVGYATNVDVNDEYVVVSSGGGNLYVFSNSDPENIHLLQRETSTGYTRDVKIDNNNTIYVATRDEGIVIFEVQK